MDKHQIKMTEKGREYRIERKFLTRRKKLGVKNNQKI